MDTRITGKKMLLLASLALLAPIAVFAAQSSAQQQVQTAEKHAAFASKAKKIDQTHLHLHHVINCLVGPGGQGFDGQAGNPCEGQGMGALNDISGAAQEKQTLERALTLAKVGTETSNYKAAHYSAMAVEALLNEAKQGK